MSWMFSQCNNLTTIPNFDTSNVTNMGWMFYRCYNLTTIPNFDTSNVTNMSYMFEYCNKLTTIPIFDTGNVTDMSSMFDSCTNIKGALYIESNNVSNAMNLFANTPKYAKAIYCHANTTTYNTIYEAMGNMTHNSNWNADLRVMEDSMAYLGWYGNGTYRFPTNRIWYDESWKGRSSIFVEITPYADYELYEKETEYGIGIFHNSLNYGEVQWGMDTPEAGAFSFFDTFFSLSDDDMILEDKI